MFSTLAAPLSDPLNPTSRIHNIPSLPRVPCNNDASPHHSRQHSLWISSIPVMRSLDVLRLPDSHPPFQCCSPYPVLISVRRQPYAAPLQSPRSTAFLISFQAHKKPPCTCKVVNILAMTYLPSKRTASIVGAEGLNFCVRDGYRCVTFAIVTRIFIFLRSLPTSQNYTVTFCSPNFSLPSLSFWLSPRLISISPLNVSPHLHS